MYPGYTILSVLLLLASTLAVPHDEDETSVSPTLKTNNVTKTIVVTVTQTSDMTVQPPTRSRRSDDPDTTSYTTGFATPPPPDSVPTPPPGTEDPEDIVPSSTRVRPTPTLICSKPMEACIIDGIAIWPSGTTSIVVPHFTFDPLPTSFKSGIQSEPTMISSTAASSGSPTTLSKSIHSMSHIVPGKPTSFIAFNSSTPTASVINLMTSQPVSISNAMSILPIDLGTSHPAPIPTNPPTINDPVQAQDIDVTTASDSNNRTGKNPVTSTFRTKVFDPVGWAGIDGALNYTKARRAHERQENKATKRRKSFWSRFIAAAESLSSAPRDVGCVPCDHNGAIICLNDTHYAICEEHCAVPWKLGTEMRCIGGQVKRQRERVL